MNDITWGMLSIALLATTIPLAISLLFSRVLHAKAAHAHFVLLVGLVVALLLPGIALFRYDDAAQTTATGPGRLLANHNIPTALVIDSQSPKESTFMESATGQTAFWNLPTLVATFVLVGMVWMLLRLTLSYLLGLRLLRRAEPLADETLYPILKATQKGLGPLPVLFSTRDVQSPAIWCWGLRPSLLIPEGAVRGAERSTWENVFEHELAHVNRRDNLWTLFCEFALCLLYWNPLAFLVRRHLLEFADAACDEHAAGHGNDPARYVEVLLSFTIQRRSLSALSLTSDKAALKRRVHRLLSEEGPIPSITPPATIGVLVAVMVGLSGVLFALPEENEATPFPNKQGNVLLNSGFESGKDAPDHWVKGKAVPGVSQEWLRDGGVRGKAYIHFEKTTARYFPIARWSQRAAVDIPVGATHVEVAGYVRCAGLTKAVIDVEFEDEAGQWGHKWAVYLGAKKAGDAPWTHDWKRYVGVVPLPAGTKTASLSLQQYGPGVVDFDEVGLRFQTSKNGMKE